MIVALDETGDFRDPKGKKFGLVTLVTITDSEWDKFSAFMATIFPSGFAGVKGKTLTKEQRGRILKYIGKKPEIKYTTTLYDLSGGSDDWVNYHKNETVRRADASIEAMKAKLQPSYIKDIRLYLNQLKNYSVGDYAKFVMYTELFIEWQKFFQFDYFYTHIKNDAWRLHHILDTQNQPNKFIRLIQATMILTTSELNPSYGIYTPQEWLKDHPFIKYHSHEGDINRHDARKFYEDFRIGDEKSEPALFLPDFIGYTIYNSILNRNTNEWLMNLKRLLQNRSLTMTNKQRNPANYYIISGFDKAKDPKDVNPIVKEHWRLMKAL
ncbi:MAG: hypothetical protein Q8O68_01485 [Candidatus Daviesbacteria bacterium]|nr:hypothetical protein [Candidatus Daviesbacteria bacterium]